MGKITLPGEVFDLSRRAFVFGWIQSQYEFERALLAKKGIALPAWQAMESDATRIHSETFEKESEYK